MYMVNDYLVRSMYRCYNLFRTRLKVCYMYTYKSINSKALEVVAKQCVVDLQYRKLMYGLQLQPSVFVVLTW